MTESFYVYALKDPRSNPAKPFYIGKGTGMRAWEHAINVDETRKGKRIAEIQQSGYEIVTAILASELSEIQAIRLEAELISAFGTEVTGGMLTNSVIPKGILNKQKEKTIVPSGIQEKAQIALTMLKDAVIELAKANVSGVTNSDVTKALGLQSDYAGGSKDYLSWSIIGLLMREGKLKREEGSKKHIIQIK
jgi:hypothetical protein